MRLVLFFSLLGCSDYQVHSTTSDGSAPGRSPDADDALVDTGDPADDDAILLEPPPAEVPDQKVYLHTGSSLYSWNPTTGALTIIGDFFRDDSGELEAITDIAIDGDGRFYGVSYTTLYGIDAYTAEIWPISPLDFPLYGLTCTYEGRIIGGGDGLYEIDPMAGTVTTLVDSGQYQTSGDLVGLPDGLLYWAVRGGDDLVVVDPDSGVSAARGEIGVEAIYGLGYADGSLYGFTDAGQVLDIDPSTGQVTRTASLPGNWWGATTNPAVW